MKATSSQLRKWRRLLVVRDSRVINPAHAEEQQIRMSVCALCGVDTFFKSYQMQAHHIMPKSLFPHRALDLENGVMLCAGHHQGIVHNNNAGVDIRDRRYDTGWLSFRDYFQRWNSLAANARYNAEQQKRLPSAHLSN